MKRGTATPFPVLIDFIVGADLEQENIVFLLTGALDEIKDNAEVIPDTTRP